VIADCVWTIASVGWLVAAVSGAERVANACSVATGVADGAHPPTTRIMHTEMKTAACVAIEAVVIS
jgi:hypothetical protein